MRSRWIIGFLVLLFILAGCANHLMPLKAASSTAVALEDLTEDPEKDAQEQMFLEGMDDTFAGPMNIMNAALLWRAVWGAGSMHTMHWQ